MARKTVDITISGGRDDGKIFVITEMSAMAAECWAFRAFLAISRSGKSAIKDALNFDFEAADWHSQATIAEIAAIGINVFGAMDYEESEPLLAAMFDCVKILPDLKNPNVTRAIMFDTDIEDVSTRLTLRKEVFKLHVDFFTAAAL